ncbi:HAD family hydrolase [uncultured Dubosiella sp.]|uniref:HAD family hydrolase n=2 Tax=uncultured Dubosiella sp. TaxID=1937011 RepID=UPI0027316FDC|nr:HAD hydrolase family protein [uncultured Dubosiella sp.]
MKLLATDYDGTLHYGEGIMQDDLDAIRQWKEDGNLFVIVTGRSMQSIDEQIKKFGLPCDYVISNNGGMVFDAAGKEMMANYLDYVTAVDIIYAMKEMDNVASYVVNDGFYRHKIVVDPGVTDHRYPRICRKRKCWIWENTPSLSFRCRARTRPTRWRSKSTISLARR